MVLSLLSISPSTGIEVLFAIHTQTWVICNSLRNHIHVNARCLPILVMASERLFADFRTRRLNANTRAERVMNNDSGTKSAH